jgi:hypothetical protein
MTRLPLLLNLDESNKSIKDEDWLKNRVTELMISSSASMGPTGPTLKALKKQYFAKNDLVI